MNITFSLAFYLILLKVPFNKIQIWYFFVNFLINNLGNTIFFLILFFCVTRLQIRSIFVLCFLKYYTFIHYTIVDELPSGLIIGYNVIHPLLFYLSIILGISLFLEKLFSLKITNILLIGFFGILLGGTWGLGNSIWGFFWVDDFIEIIFLSYLIVLLIITHITFYKNYVSYYYVYIFFIIILLISSRWGLIFTRHSFFNILNLYNIFFLFFFLFFVNFFPPLLIFVFLTKYYIYLTIIFLLFRLAPLSNYGKRWVFIHMLFLISYASWIKLREYNLLYFFIKYKTNFESIIFTWNINYDSFFLIFFKKYFLSFFKLSVYTVYNIKYYVTIAYSSILTYPFFFFLVLISIYKIYKNYLQN